MIWKGIRLVGLCLLAPCALSCDQPPADCTTGHGGFAAVYTLKEKQGTGVCDRLNGDIIGLEKYNPSQADDPKKQDLTKAKLRIRTQKLSDDAANNGLAFEGLALDSLGEFMSSTPDEENVCSVPMMTDASITLASGDSISYSWSNVRIYVTTAYPGTQMVADLEYKEGDCTATYSVVGLWPAVSCADDKGKADKTLCSPTADPAAGRATGSGINPDFAARVDCDEETLRCVLTDVPDALK